MGMAAYAFWPTLEIEGVPWDNSRGPFDAKFQFTNGGRVPIYQVHVRCTVNTATAKNIVTEKLDHLPGYRRAWARHNGNTRWCGGTTRLRFFVQLRTASL
jgi:hypothetical protein